MKLTLTKLFNQALSGILLLSFSFALSGTSVAQRCTPGNFSISNRPPISCSPYPNSLWHKPLPNAGSGGPMNHLAPNSDAIIKNPGTGCVGCGNFMPGFSNIVPSNPFYYGRASDPIYKVDACTNHSGGATYDPAGTFWHIPNQARYAGLHGDQFLTVWDQTTNMVLSTYKYGSGVVPIPACSATTTATACSMGPIGYCSMANYSTDKGYQAGSGAGDSLHEAPAALVIRVEEWMAGTINHALYINGSCEAGGPGSGAPPGSTVFPATPGITAAECNHPAGLKPIHGSLIFMDYTDVQIAAMNLPPWQKAIIIAMSHYGGYFGDTNDSAAAGHDNQGMYPTRTETAEAYATAGIAWPLQSWLSGQSGVANGTQLRFWNNIPLVGGTDVMHHTHIADPCVPLGLAGQPGGCVDTATTALPEAPTGLTATAN